MAFLSTHHVTREYQMGGERVHALAGVSVEIEPTSPNAKPAPSSYLIMRY